MPATNASFAARPSRHVTSCMFIVAASVSRSRLLRASSCSRACDSSWFAGHVLAAPEQFAGGDLVEDGRHLVVAAAGRSGRRPRGPARRSAAGRGSRAPEPTWWPPIIATESVISTVAYCRSKRAGAAARSAGRACRRPLERQRASHRYAAPVGSPLLSA